MKKILYLILLLAVAACKKEKDKTEMVSDTILTPVSDTIGKGVFNGQQHSLSGKVVLYKDITNNHILRLENFNMTSAPDADIYLSQSASYNSNTVIKVHNFSTSNYVNSNINIDIPEDINYANYPYVIVWCTQFSAFFGSAYLQ